MLQGGRRTEIQVWFTLEAFPHKRRLKSDTISVTGADNTFITSDGTSPYNSTRKWAVKRHYREDNNQHPHSDINYEEVIKVLRHTKLSAGDPIHRQGWV